MTVLVTGAPGNVGTPLVAELAAAGAPVRVAAVDPDRAEASFRDTGGGLEVVRFDFTDPGTWSTAFAGVERMFLLRPPQLSRVRRDLLPALDAAAACGVGHVVFLSIQGADRNRLVPHRAVEDYLRASPMAWTFVRAAYFMENLSTTHAPEIRQRGEIWVPAGGGRTAFVAARDVAAVAARTLLEAGHEGAAYTPTGPAALTYRQCAEVLTEVLGRPVRYRDPGPLAYWRRMRARGMPAGMVAVTLGIYTMARLGLAAGLTDDVRALTGRAPLDFRSFACDHAAAWRPAAASSAV